MLVYVRGKTLVKGVRSKNVYYVGDVQDDGYIYFNDEMSFRVPKPATLTNTKTTINVSEVQIWYTIRNCWIRANHFTDLTVYGFDPKEIYDVLDEHERRLDDLEDRMDDAERRLDLLEDRMDDVEARCTALESRCTVLEGRCTALENRCTILEGRCTDLENRCTVLESRCTDLEYRCTQLETRMTTAETNISNLQTRMSTAEANISNLQGRMNTAETNILNLQTRMTQAETDINSLDVRVTTNETNITTNRNNIRTINELLGALSSFLANQGSGYTNLADYLRDEFNARITYQNTTDGRLNNIENTEIPNLWTNVNRNRQDINTLQSDYTTLDALVTAAGNTLNTLSSLVGTINSSLSVFINDYNAYTAQTDSHVEALRQRVNRNGSWAFANNGQELYNAFTKLNDVITWCRSQGSTVGYISGSIYDRYNDPVTW